MEQHALKCSPEELAEIERHKYFLSEEAGYDVGIEFAERDWEDNFGKQFRLLHAANDQVVSRGPFLKRFLSKFTSNNR
jgi:hypothetical protein